MCLSLQGNDTRKVHKRSEKYTKILALENVKVWDQVEDQNLADRIILKCNLKKYRVRTGTAFIRICIGSSKAQLWTW
jgi:hypothetical protein